AQSLGIVMLSGGKRRRRERIFPAKAVPVIHVLAHRDDLSSGNRLPVELLKNLICRWTAGASFGGEEFDQDWCAGSGRAFAGSRVAGVQQRRQNEQRCRNAVPFHTRCLYFSVRVRTAALLDAWRQSEFTFLLTMLVFSQQPPAACQPYFASALA